jgi:hypothetical protein
MCSACGPRSSPSADGFAFLHSVLRGEFPCFIGTIKARGGRGSGRRGFGFGDGFALKFFQGGANELGVAGGDEADDFGGCIVDLLHLAVEGQGEVVDFVCKLQGAGRRNRRALREALPQRGSSTDSSLTWTLMMAFSM